MSNPEEEATKRWLKIYFYIDFGDLGERNSGRIMSEEARLQYSKEYEWEVKKQSEYIKGFKKFHNED